MQRLQATSCRKESSKYCFPPLKKGSKIAIFSPAARISRGGSLRSPQIGHPCSDAQPRQPLRVVDTQGNEGLASSKAQLPVENCSMPPIQCSRTLSERFFFLCKREQSVRISSVASRDVPPAIGIALAAIIGKCAVNTCLV